MKLKRLIHIALIAVAGLVLYSCANIGSPEGGPMDYLPPKFVKSSPAQGAVNVKGNKIEITFDEIVNIKDQQKKVSVSPVQKNPPVIKAMGKKLTIEFRDEMKPNTTYSIDFSNSIEDNNEGNPLDGFSFAFSTGDEVDSLQISGIMLRARDLEPMQHIIVGIHSNLDDTAFTNIPLERMCRTNDRGEFTLRNLKPGRYHIFGLNDMDGNYRMARTENIAFLDEIIVPGATRYQSQDTVFTFDNKVDTVVTGTHTEFTPNNVLLTMFNENFRSVYLKTNTRPQPARMFVQLSAPCEQLPKLNIIEPKEHAQDWYIAEYTENKDSIFYWITDSALIKSDSILVAMEHVYTDSTDNLSMKTDTVRFDYRKSGTQLKQEAAEKKEREQRAKRIAQLREKQAKGKELSPEELRDIEDAEKPVIPKLNVELKAQSQFDVYDSLKLTFATPIASIDKAGVHLEIKRDTLWHEINDIPEFVPVRDGSVLEYYLPMTFDPDSTYRMTVDSLAITSIYGIHNDPVVSQFKVKAIEDYGNLLVNVNVKDKAFVELVNGSDVVQRTIPVVNGKVDIPNVLPGTYYLRLVLDANDNGVWDTGNYAQHLQPEEVYYYPKRLKVRKNWDMEESWNIYATALDLQKPVELRRNKPEQSKSKLDQKRNKDKNGRNGSRDDDEEEDDEFNNRGFGNGVYSGNKYQDYQNNNRRQR